MRVQKLTREEAQEILDNTETTEVYAETRKTFDGVSAEAVRDVLEEVRSALRDSDSPDLREMKAALTDELKERVETVSVLETSTGIRIDKADAIIEHDGSILFTDPTIQVTASDEVTISNGDTYEVTSVERTKRPAWVVCRTK